MNYESKLHHLKAAVGFVRMIKGSLFPSLFVTSLSKERVRVGNCIFRYLELQAQVYKLMVNIMLK